ncbi:MAG: FtsX-like permease family protein [Calditrichaeota bacterium]|nr:FtsX-like permease family protein [Calditrichota bacterium]
MLIEENIRIAVTQIRTGKMRSLLTTLGIMIGIGTVIFIVSILEGYNRSIERELNVLGANTFQVQREEVFTGIQIGRRKRKERKRLDKELADAIRKNADLIQAVGAEVWEFNVMVKYKEKSTNPVMTLAGAQPEFFPTNGYSVREGRALTYEDIRSNRKVIVIGIDVVEKLFPFEDPLGKKVKVKGKKFEVIGVLEKMGSRTFGESRDNRIIIPITTFEDMLGKKRSCNLTVMVKKGADMQAAMDQVIGVLRKERKIPPGKENDFSIFTNETLIQSFNNIAGKIKIGAIFLGLISLLVGSIGVMNIMLVTVTERTREIGIRKAVGARKSAILFQFLIEAVALCFVGGIIGMSLGFILAAIVGGSLNIPFTVPMWAVSSSLIVTTLVGVIAGMYPAMRAANMDPIIALRYE